MTMEGMSKPRDACCAQPCLLNDKSKEREKRILSCSSPGCVKSFHVGCIGKSKISDKELMGLFFICLRCERYLEYGAEISRKTLMTEFDNKLIALEESILKTINERFEKEVEYLKRHTMSLLDQSTKLYEDKLKNLNSDVQVSLDSFERLLKEKDKAIVSLKSELQSLNEQCTHNLSEMKATYNSVNVKMSSIDSLNRKKSFIIRNYPERDNSNETLENVLMSIARPLNIEQELRNIEQAFRLGKPHHNGKPRLILVKTTERTAKLFLSRSRLLKHADRPLNKVFIQENLSSEDNKKMAEMRKRAFEYRAQNPGEEAFVRNKKLFINGIIVDELSKKNF